MSTEKRLEEIQKRKTEILSEMAGSKLVSHKISQAVDEIDPNMNHSVFAEAIVNIIRSEYGSHLYGDFLQIFNNSLR